jgi:hypothetical protein
MSSDAVKSALTPYLHRERPNHYVLYSLNSFHKLDDDHSSLFYFFHLFGGLSIFWTLDTICLFCIVCCLDYLRVFQLIFCILDFTYVHCLTT